MAAGAIQPITPDDIQTVKSLADVVGGKPLEEAFPAEKPFNQYDESDWGRFVGQVGLQAAQAAPLIAGLRGAPEPEIPSRAQPSVADAIQAQTEQPVPESFQPQPQAPLSATEQKFNRETLQWEPKTDRDFWFDGLDLRQSVTDGLARLGVDASQTDLPSAEQFSNGRDFFNAMRDAEMKMRQSGAKVAGFMFQDRGYVPQAPTAQSEIITPSLGDPFHPPEIPPQDVPYAGGQQAPAPPTAEVPASGAAGTSNRQNVVTYGEDVVPGGTGADTTQLLDKARTDIRSGAVDPYSILSKTRQSGIANPEEYAALAAEHERLVNDAVAKQKANDPSAPEAVQRATDFANAIQTHKTAASDLFRLMQGDLNYDLGTPFGMDQYMKAELGRGITPSEAPRFNKMSQDIGNGQTEVAKAVARSDARVRNAYAKVADIPMDQAVARVKQMLKDCL